MQSWGFQVRRAIDARQEVDDWAFFPRHSAGVVHYYGRLNDLVDLPPPRLFEATPFALGKVEHRAAGAQNVLSHGWFAGGSAGLDALAHLTNELTLDLTVNPDFGQVEADTVILNLSTFETFFPEKRRFFLEGLDVFATLRPVFYTRRIGRQPAAPTLSTGEALVALPDPTRIWSAVKMSGTVGGRTTVGVLSALTGENDVDVQGPDGTRRARLTEPITTYNVLRLKRLVAANADVGLLATATNRFDPSVPAGAGCPATLAAPTGGRCTNDAYVLSLDGRWRSKSGDYALAWQTIGSALSGGAPRAEPDGIPIQPGQPAGGASAYVAKEGGPHWLWSVWQHVTGRQLEFNDLGYLERKNDVNGSYTLSYRTLRPWWRTVETRTNLQLNLRQTLDGLNLWRELIANTTFTLPTFWSVTFEVHGRGDYYDDREMGDGSALQRPGNVGALLSLATDPRKRVIGWLSGDVDRRRGGYHLDLHGQLTLRLLPQLQIDLVPTVGYDSGAPRYVGTDVTPVLIGDVADYRFGVQTAVSAGRHRPGGVHLHAPALAAVLHAAVLREGELQRLLRVSQAGLPRAGRPGRADPGWPARGQPRQPAGDAERQLGAEVGVPARLDAVPRLHARTDTGAGGAARRHGTAGAGADLARPGVGRRADGQARLLAGLNLPASSSSSARRDVSARVSQRNRPTAPPAHRGHARRARVCGLRGVGIAGAISVDVGTKKPTPTRRRDNDSQYTVWDFGSGSVGWLGVRGAGEAPGREDPGRRSGRHGGPRWRRRQARQEDQEEQQEGERRRHQDRGRQGDEREVIRLQVSDETVAGARAAPATRRSRRSRQTRQALTPTTASASAHAIQISADQ